MLARAGFHQPSWIVTVPSVPPISASPAARQVESAEQLCDAALVAHVQAREYVDAGFAETADGLHVARFAEAVHREKRLVDADVEQPAHTNPISPMGSASKCSRSRR